MIDDLKARYNQIKEENLQLDMTRGKPSNAQLDLSLPLLTILKEEDFCSPSGVDCRNYSAMDLLAGLPELKTLFSECFELTNADMIVGGHSSLKLMYDTISALILHSTPDNLLPWGKQEKIKFLCPAPGYDRHFGICESLGIEMVRVNLTGYGPDMDQVEHLVQSDESIKGIWCVPKYSNPTGETYSDETVKRLASMKTKAEDFRIFWDNAYAVHHLTDEPSELLDIFSACRLANNPNRVYSFASTSKITFASSGVSLVASSQENITWLKKIFSYQLISFDKLNQLRHLKFLETKDAFLNHMRQHMRILKPKFDAVLRTLEKELGTDGAYATWNEPKGGYFISLNTKQNLAKRVVEMAKACGVKLTQAGATYPYGEDPNDTNIRIAPSMPSVAEITKASEVLALCIQIATIEAESHCAV
ncbi:aminotransferase class I/II-fold pyridoxal phosphate-dependent enzyme [Thiotrichales bacterium 19S11-10]|nr:aminotransferase class I/II-fold pyridoxal phosphate-dependent enzyme [Thiotrichales bacterium 19S11-10]